MSPIIDLQRRLREAGRIRIGEKVETRNGKMAPSKLSEFRFTSSDERAIRAIAEMYGGVVQPWTGAPVGEQWEVVTESRVLDVVVPPVDLAFSQWMELWAGGGCARRCDGQRNVITDQPCVCDPDVPDCKPTTRLGVILTGLDGIGIWRLEIHGWNGAQELLGSIEVLRTMQSRGAMVPARLLLDQRQSKKGGKTHNFAVPVLDLTFNVAAALTDGAERTSVTPIPRDEPVLTMAEQLAAVDSPERLRPSLRAGAAQAIPKTGLVPRTAAEVLDAEVVSTSSKKPVVAEPETSPALRRLRAMMKGNTYINEYGDDGQAWATAYLGRPVTALEELTLDEIKTLEGLIRGGAISSAASVTAVPVASEQYDNPNERPF